MSDNQDVWYDSSTVAYWDVITDLNTVGKGGLDLNTGQFTAGPLIIGDCHGHSLPHHKNQL